MDRETKNLVKRIKEGNCSAYEKLFYAYYESLCNFAWQIVHSEHISEELVQDVFLEVWKKREALDPHQKIKTYLFQAVRNKAINYLKHEKVARKYKDKIDWLKSESTLQGHDFEDESEFVKSAQQAIQDLPERARLVYKLNRRDGLTYKEIAEVLDISPRTVESQISRALEKLRDKLSKYLKGSSSILLNN